MVSGILALRHVHICRSPETCTGVREPLGCVLGQRGNRSVTGLQAGRPGDELGPLGATWALRSVLGQAGVPSEPSRPLRPEL